MKCFVLSLVLVSVIGLICPSAFAQTSPSGEMRPWDQNQLQMRQIQQLLAQQKTELAEHRRLLQQLTESVTWLVAQQAATNILGKPKDQARQDARALAGGLEAVNYSENTQLHESVRQKIEQCRASVRDAVGKGPQTWTGLPNCSEGDIQSVQMEIERFGLANQDDYRRCVEIINADLPAMHAALPMDGSIVSDESIDEVNTAPLDTASARACADSLHQTIRNIRDADNAQQAFARILGAAANMCLAAGGEPHVCLGLLAISLFMQLFNGGSGEGPDDGPGEGAGGGGVPSATADPGQDGQGGAGDSPGMSTGSLGSLRNGKVTCDGRQHGVACWFVAGASRLRLFESSPDPERASSSRKCEQRLANIAAQNRSVQELEVCVTPDESRIIGLAFPLGEQLCVVGTQDDGGKARSKFLDPAPKTKAGGCASVRP